MYLFTDAGEFVDWVVGVYRSSSGSFHSLETKSLVENFERNPWKFEERRKGVHPGGKESTMSRRHERSLGFIKKIFASEFKMKATNNYILSGFRLSISVVYW